MNTAFDPDHGDFTEFHAYGSILVPPGSLPFALFHGESLVACAAWALDGAEVQLVDDSVTWEGLEPPDPELEDLVFVVHDCLCPGVEPAFISECVKLALETGVVVAASRPVTDTVKRVQDGAVTDTVDRESLAQITSPVVLPLSAVAVAAELWPGGPERLPLDTADLVAGLAERVPVHFAEAPSQTRRIQEKGDLVALEALTQPQR